MNRRAFIQSALFTTAWTAYGTAFAGQSDRHSGKWIIPTNKPDRFGLKVMAFNPIRIPDPAAYRLTITGLVHESLQLTTADLDRLVKVKQNSRLKCVQCWSGRMDWEGFRAQDLLKLAPPKAEGRLGARRLRRQVLRLREARGPAASADAVRDRDAGRGADARSTARRCGWCCRTSTATSRRS